MQILIDKILKEGQVLQSNILKVDSFINHQMDIKLFNEIGKEFKRRFDNKEVTKILTIEASGIGIAVITSQYFNFAPVVFAKKTLGGNFSGEAYEAEVHSYTKKQTCIIKVNKNYIQPGDKVLIIDDFLANGQAALGLINVVRQAAAEVVGVGIVIEKGFQDGRNIIEKQGVQLESLAIIDRFENKKVVFR
ncbi:xanthine phosphoribosyltransferase [Clostridium sp. SYSU_GA19001]|uniref:xanthine phosphoribosyltransferase n=1 Tax=Clostridium caldaquaticum TaxID=2940653 RepID=UPI00207743CB|nr:xanthine phosphoribosyltransferase [Clostridium caldaquaticum]MCM8709650.1 xanthine phosphoribosyltransferase [Clostridium caldaquaticum]